MPPPADRPLEGPDAAAVVAADPFWSVVRRHHRDVDIVVLPPGDVPDLTPAPGDVPGDTDTLRAAFDEDVAELWKHLGQPDTRPGVRWTPAPNRGAVALEGRVAAEDVAPDVAAATLRRAVQRLAGEGWHVLVPPGGIPRVAAGQARRTGRRTAQVVHVPEPRRLLLVVRSEPIPAPRITADTLLGGAR
ncbi:hypothetical protein [Nocardioides piscis]|uniref:Uncharacterized protein n=1 Tax=Nocardioides piscis TaxID=2714938 RepID=A0A6G7YK37_9ACTN|nr:hypothetical protein [Nocardioides piscis]QIK77086.1 hypothetical protein G7071_18245 [Nocardioides piscis]